MNQKIIPKLREIGVNVHLSSNVKSKRKITSQLVRKNLSRCGDFGHLTFDKKNVDFLRERSYLSFRGVRIPFTHWLTRIL